MALFWGVAILLFTTFFTNLRGGLSTGIVGSLGYWLTQHEVARGSQPWFYYLLLAVLYEILPLVAGSIAIVAAAVALRRSSWDPARGDLGSEEIASEPDAAQDGAAVASVGRSDRRSFFSFLLWWAIATWGAYTWAGEKMPWLVTHLMLPLEIFAGWGIARLILAARAGSKAGALALVAGGAVLPVLALEWIAGPAFAGASTAAVADTMKWVVRALVLLVLLAFVVRAAWRAGMRPAGRWLALGVGRAPPRAHAAGRHPALLHELRPRDRAPLLRAGNARREARDARDRAHQRALGRRSRAVRRLRRPELVAVRVVPARLSEEPHLGHAGAVRAGRRRHHHRTQESRRRLAAGGGRLRQARVPADLVAGAGVLQQGPARSGAAAARSGAPSPAVADGDVPRLLAHGRREVGSAPGLRDVRARRRGAARAGGARPGRYRGRERRLDRVVVVSSSAPAAAGTGTRLEPQPRAIFTGPFEGLALAGPTDIAIAPDGARVIADAGNHRIVVLERDGTLRRAFGGKCDISQAASSGCVDPDGAGPLELGDGQFNEPWGVAVGPSGQIFVSDTWNHRVERFDSSGRFSGKWGRFGNNPVAGGAPAEEPIFYGPRGISDGFDGELVVSDTGNKRLLVFSPDGGLLRTIGSGGGGPEQWNEPVGIAPDQNGTLLVADTWNRRVKRLDRRYAAIANWRVPDWRSESVSDKPFVAADDNGMVYAGDPAGGRVWIFAPSGRLEGTLILPALATGKPRPLGMVVDGAAGEFLVVDQTGGRVLVYALPNLRTGQAQS